MQRISKVLDNINAAIDREAGWIVFLAVIVFVFLTFGSRLAETPLRWPICVGASIVLLASILLFTRPLKIESDVNAIFRYAWAFLVATVILGIVTLYATVQQPDETKATSQPMSIQTSRPTAAASNSAEEATDATQPDAESYRRKLYVIALVRGCDYNSDPSKLSPTQISQLKEGSDTAGTPLTRPTNPAMPAGLNCGDLPPQWVISIGGSIIKCHYDGTCPKDRRPKDHAPALRKQLATIEAQLRQLDARAGALANQVRGARALMADDIAYGGSLDNLSASQRDAENKRDILADQASRLRERIDASDGWEDLAKNIDGGPIVGGIVVPVYFVVLAWVGALISMMRKLPEFQNRVTERYETDYKKKTAAGESPLPPISYEYARDLTVFQLLQVLSAPAIAVVAYAWARPEQLMTTVLLAFAAGFSSEIFLLAIRGVVDRVVGLGPLPLRLRAIQEQGAPGAGVAIPPRGPAPPSTSSPPATAKFKVNDRVELAAPVGPFMPGARGIVVAITTGSDIVVRVTNDHIGTPQNFVLDPRPPDSFRLPGKDSGTDAEPAPVG